MPEIGEMAEATVRAVHAPERVAPHRRRPGYCTVECKWGSYNLVDGSVQQVHPADRVVGQTGYLVWVKSGSYCGPAWQRGRDVEGQCA